MRDIELRRRVARLCDGDFRNEDLTRIFLVLRERSFGAATVKEIGDFVAHADTRTKGVTTQRVRDFFDTLRLIVPNLDAQLDINNLPEVFPRAARANLRLLDVSILKRDTGLKRKTAESVLESALSKLEAKRAGGFRLIGQLSAQERLVLQCCCRYIISKPAFTADQLAKEFCFSLQKNELLDSVQKAALLKRRDLLSLYVVATMHQTKILLDDRTDAQLRADVDQDTLQVTALADCPLNNGTVIQISGPIFTTELRAEDYCDPSLLADNSIWNAPLEISQDGKLVPL